MSKRSAVHINLEFAGALLPVETNEQGKHVVPLKPICDAIGLEWERQRKKVSEPYLSKRLGTCTVHIRGADRAREMVCIHMNRVAAFLNTVNPESVRGQGNESTADFLEAKHQEWDDLIDAYERGFGIMAKSGKSKQPGVRDFLSVLRAKKQTDSEPERKVLHLLARKIAEDLARRSRRTSSTTPVEDNEVSPRALSWRMTRGEPHRMGVGFVRPPFGSSWRIITIRPRSVYTFFEASALTSS